MCGIAGIWGRGDVESVSTVPDGPAPPLDQPGQAARPGRVDGSSPDLTSLNP